MLKRAFKKALNDFVKIASTIIILVSGYYVFVGVYRLAFVNGYDAGLSDTRSYYEEILSRMATQSAQTNIITRNIYLTPAPQIDDNNDSGLFRTVSWGGPELWETVNKRRPELGVNPLSLREDLCTIASIRLNELLNLGDLDGHEGFTNFQERRPDLKYIFENYSAVAEFLAAGASTPEATVALWENTLGHRKLLTGGEFVWGCIYAQSSFAVAIAAY